MAENNKTIWQYLAGVFTGNNRLPNETENIDKGLIIEPTKVNQKLVADSPQELELKALEQRQNKFLQNQYIKVVNDDYYGKIMGFETTRLAAYLDYEGMEYYPTIAEALNIYAEESTTMGENGKILNIYSNSKRVKTILENLFYDKLDINTNLTFWARNLAKYGDNFLYLYAEPSQGIIEARQLPNIEIVRREEVDKETGKIKIFFEHQQKNEKYNIFNIAHFRLLGDDKNLPYGTSILAKVRKIWKLLVLGEDAMMFYRVTRAAERRVFKIDVGNIDEDDIPQYMQKVASAFKKQTLVDKDGNINFRKAVIDNDMDYFIPTRGTNSGTVIDTLPGAQNLDAIGDLSFLNDKLFTGLGVPKSMLNYSGENAQGGKNLAQEDIRFARRVQRLQQALLLELNKMAILELSLKGFKEEINNFELKLTNPSTQAELLKVELWTQKVQLFTQLTSPNADTGIAPMSETKARSFIFGWSNDEIMDDIKKQMFERAVSDELKNVSVNINQTGVFDELYRIYGKKLKPQGEANTQEAPPAEDSGFGGAGAPPMSPPAPPTDLGGTPPTETQEPELTDTNEPETPRPENIYKKNNLINEDIKRMIDETDKMLREWKK